MADGLAQAAESAAHHGGGVDLPALLILLGAAVIAVPIFRKLGLGSVLGYLAAGLVIGPFGLGFFTDAQSIIHVAELGVVLFLFVIGLEMQPSRLWAMRGEIFGLGMMQVVGAAAALTLVGLSLGYPAAASFVAAAGFVLTSTAVVMQTLTERGQMETPMGRRVISILLLEDLAIIPLLALVAFIAPGAEEANLAAQAQAVAIGLAAVAVLVLAGRYLLNPMFGFLARFGVREIMTAAALLVVFGSALLMQAGGLSMAMGAFMAGVLLSESSYRHQLEADVEPFRGLLLGLFFLGVGMALDLDVVAANLALIALCVPAYIILKMAVIYAVGRVLGTSRREATERAVLMAQGGEFAFVLYAAAMQAGILRPEWNAVMIAIIVCSMALTPLMMAAYDRLAPKERVSLDGVEEVNGTTAPVLLIGFDRFAQIVSQPLLARGCELTIIETDPARIRMAETYGFKVWFGDGARLDILHAAGAAEASLIIAAPADPRAVTRITELVKHHFPMVPVFARAHDREHALELIQAGADFQIRDTLESAFLMGREALTRLGETPELADEIVLKSRDRDREWLAFQIVEGVDARREMVIGNSGRK